MTPDLIGKAVIQRVLPVGGHQIAVQITNPGASPVTISRDIIVPKSGWFYVGVVDLTVGRNINGGADGGGETYSLGRVSGYAKGTTASGYQITAQVDSGEDNIDDLFRNVLNKDPQSIINRLDPDLAYPTYGDDSTLIIDAPTLGGFYLKVEKDGNFGLWRDFKSECPGTELLRNERTLYGAQTVLQTQETNNDGSPKVRFEGYAAQPDQLRPLSGYGGSGALLSSNPNCQDTLNLVAQYEWRPVTGDVDGYAHGARVTSGIADGLQVGATLQVDTSGTCQQNGHLKRADLHRTGAL